MARKIRNISLYLTDIAESISKIQKYTHGINFEEFCGDDKTIDAVIRNFEIIGEAANQLPKEFKQINDTIEWKILTDFRNIVIHEYFGINKEIIWDIIENELPAFKLNIENLISQNNESPLLF